MYVSSSALKFNGGQGIVLMLFSLSSSVQMCCTCYTWLALKACMDRLDAFHRCQLRSLLGVRHPAKIFNTLLYKKCHSSPISETISRRRLTMLGHTLRLTEVTPPQQAIGLYRTSIRCQARSRQRLPLHCSHSCCSSLAIA